MKFTLLDHWERTQEVWVHDPSCPVLVDDRGRRVLLLEDVGFPLRYERPSPEDPFCKKITDSFMMRPAPRLPSTSWIDYPEDDKIYQFHFLRFQEALLLLTGKLLIGVGK